MDNLTSSVTAKTYKVNHKLNCNDKCLIYMLAWNHCRNQYVEESLIVSGIGGTITNLTTACLLEMRVYTKTLI